MKSVNLIGHSKFLPWQQLDGCSVSRPFLLSAKGCAYETIGMRLITHDVGSCDVMRLIVETALVCSILYLHQRKKLGMSCR